MKCKKKKLFKLVSVREKKKRKENEKKGGRKWGRAGSVSNYFIFSSKNKRATRKWGKSTGANLFFPFLIREKIK